MSIRGGFMTRLHGEGREETSHLSQLDRQSLRLVWKYARVHIGRLLLAVLCMLIVTATAITMPYLTKVALDTYITKGDLRGLLWVSLFYLGLNSVYWLAVYWQSYLSAWVSQHIIYAIRHDLFDHVLRQSIAFHEEERVGQITSRLTSDVDALSEIVSSGALNLISDLLTLIGIIVVMALLNAQLTLVILASIPLVIISIGYLGKQMRRTYRQVQQALADVNTGVEQGIAGMRVVQSLSRESLTVQEFESLSLRNMRANLRAGILFAAVFPTMTVTNMLGMALVLGYGGNLVMDGAITIGVLLAFLGYVYRFFGPLRELSLVYNTFQAAAASLDRIADYMEREPQVAEPVRPQRPADGFKGNIAVNGVTFGYGEEPVLHDLNLDVSAGETIALVGPTGAGKSTIAKLLARLYDVQEGAVQIDGIDVRHIGSADLRTLVTIVPQDIFLFDGTVRENIRYGDPEASNAQVKAATQRAQAHSFVEKLPRGYDSQVGELGAKLSGGQKQLVAFARALLTDPKILILDEATANVDAYTEALIQEAMDEIRRNRTTLIIAHRFSTLRKADRIVVVEDGRIVAQGRHEDLIESSPAYQRLYRRQWANEA